MSIKSFSSFNEEAGKNWIKDAIKHPGALKASMGKSKDDKISKEEIKDEISDLKKKDKDTSKKGIQGLSKKDLTKFRRLNLAKTLISLKEHQEQKNYMFFGNLETMKRMIDELLNMDPSKLDSILDEHDWASDHISVSTENLEQVFNFLSGHDAPESEETEEEYTSEEPTEEEISQEESEIDSDEVDSKIKGFEDFQ